MTNNTLKASLSNVRNLVSLEKLTIPSYQRPYKWKEKNVQQLLTDLWSSYKENKSTYRIGTVIIHQDLDKKALHIVDGQQRLVTITLILYFLKNESLCLLNSEFPHSDSRKNIVFNFKVITSWFHNSNADEKNGFKTYLLENCEFVRIDLTDISEAFQLFDSQNARGKALEPYDLLKAFHLREMEQNSLDEKLDCVKKWEKSADDGLLKEILGSFLFRIRKWAKGTDSGYFDKEQIDEFKGINLNKYRNYPYLKPLMINDAIVTQMDENSINDCFDSNIHFPFQITQMILNGKRFFELIGFYSEIYRALFKKNDSDFYSFYEKHCHYQGSHRSGDVYVKEMYEALILFYVDKFGKMDFENISKMMYKWSFILRLKQSRVSYASIDKYIRENNNPFVAMYQAYHPHALKLKCDKPDVEKGKSIKEVEEVFAI